MSEKWRQSEIFIVINDKPQSSIAKHKVLWVTLIIQSAGERIFTIDEHLAKLQTKWLIVSCQSCAPFALHFCPQRCWSRQISWITCVLRTETASNHCYVNRQINVSYYQQLSTAVDLFWLTDRQTDAINDWPTTDNVRQFAVTAVLCCGSCVQWVVGFFYMAM